MKKESKGNFWDFLENAVTEQELQKKMQQVVKTKGKGMKPERLHKEFLKLGYFGVSLDDCNKILYGLKHGGDDWVY